MKTRTRFLPLLLGAVLVPTLLAGCSPQPNSNAIAPHGGGKGTTVAPVADPSSAPSSSPSISVGKEGGNPKDDKTLLTQDSIVKQASQMFTGVEGTTKYSKEEVLKALFSARFAFDTMQDSPAFIGGQWERGGYPSSSLVPFGDYFVQKEYAALLKSVTKLGTSHQARGDLLLFTSYFPTSDGHYVLCDGGKALTCEVSGYPKYSNYSVANAKDGGLFISFDVENRYVATKDGVKGYIPVTKTIKLSMVKNPNYSSDLGTMPYVINGWSGTYDRGSFAQ